LAREPARAVPELEEVVTQAAHTLHNQAEEKDGNDTKGWVNQQALELASLQDNTAHG